MRLGLGLGLLVGFVWARRTAASAVLLWRPLAGRSASMGASGVVYDRYSAHMSAQQWLSPPPPSVCCCGGCGGVRGAARQRGATRSKGESSSRSSSSAKVLVRARARVRVRDRVRDRVRVRVAYPNPNP